MKLLTTIVNVLLFLFCLIEMKDRYKIFHRNMKKAKQFMESEEGTAVYGPNEFSDMSGKEGEL